MGGARTNAGATHPYLGQVSEGGGGTGPPWPLVLLPALFVADASSGLSSCESHPQSLLSPIRRPVLCSVPQRVALATVPTPACGQACVFPLFAHSALTRLVLCTPPTPDSPSAVGWLHEASCGRAEHPVGSCVASQGAGPSLPEKEGSSVLPAASHVADPLVR